MFSIVLVGCDESTTIDVGPNPKGENPPGAEYETENIGEDPGAETEDNSTDGDS